MAGRPPLVDAHVHLWDLDRITYPWLQPPFADGGPNGSVEAIASTYLVDDYLADASSWDVRGIVHVDAGAEPSAALEETLWLQELAHTRGLPNGIVAFAALHSSGAEAVLEAHSACPDVRGIRQIVNWHADPARTYTPSDVTLDPAWARGFGQLARYGFSFDLQCYPSQMPALAKIFARNPDVPVIVNHLGMPIADERSGLDEWRIGMSALASLSHVSVKISGAGFAYRPWSVSQIRPIVRHTIDLFGTARCMVASDFPTDSLFGDFDETLDAYLSVVDDLTGDELRDLFGRNTNRIYRLGLNL